MTSQGSYLGNEQVSFPSGLLLLWQSDHLLLILFGDTTSQHSPPLGSAADGSGKMESGAAFTSRLQRQGTSTSVPAASHPPRGAAAAKLIASRTHAAEHTLWYGQATGKRDLNAELCGNLIQPGPSPCFSLLFVSTNNSSTSCFLPAPTASGGADLP